jgi:hypothetical protein
MYETEKNLIRANTPISSMTPVVRRAKCTVKKYGRKQTSILTYRLAPTYERSLNVFPELLPVTFAKAISELQQRTCVGFTPNFHELIPIFKSLLLYAF